MSCTEILKSHEALAVRAKESVNQREQVITALSKSTLLESLPLSIFCAGSLARKEIGLKSDLDVFVIAQSNDDLRSRLCEYCLFAELIRINSELRKPPFSNDGEYLSSTFRISRGVAESLGESSEEAGGDFHGFRILPGHP